MAPTNKVTKREPKTPTKPTARKSSPAKKTPAKASAAADENVRLLWLCLKGLLDQGQKINFQSVADGMGLTIGAAKKRLERLKNVIETDTPNVEADEGHEAEDEFMDYIKDESE